MDAKRYFEPVAGARWTTSLRLGERYVALVQDTELFYKSDAEFVLQALQIPVTAANLNTFFPNLRGKGRCPTLDLLELFATRLNPTNSFAKKKGLEPGV